MGYKKINPAGLPISFFEIERLRKLLQSMDEKRNSREDFPGCSISF